MCKWRNKIENEGTKEISEKLLLPIAILVYS